MPAIPPTGIGGPDAGVAVGVPPGGVGEGVGTGLGDGDGLGEGEGLGDGEGDAVGTNVFVMVHEPAERSAWQVPAGEPPPL